MRKAVLFSVIIFVGCSPIEVSRLLGVGTTPFKKHGKVYSNTVYGDVPSCYQKAIDMIGKMGARFYRGNPKKKYIVAIGFDNKFKWCNESTEVAIFFQKQEHQRTKVEVASLNYSLAEFVAQKLFEEFEVDEDLYNN